MCSPTIAEDSLRPKIFTAHLRPRRTWTTSSGSPVPTNNLEQLPTVAIRGGRFSSADLKTAERAEDPSGVASSYHHLGRLAQGRGNLDEAETSTVSRLELKEKLGDQLAVASTRHQLGTVAQQRGDLDEAESLFRAGLDISERLGDQPSVASGYHQLGTIATHNRGDLDKAEELFQRAIEISGGMRRIPRDSRPPSVSLPHSKKTRGRSRIRSSSTARHSASGFASKSLPDQT